MRSIYRWQLRGLLVATELLFLAQLVVLAVGVNAVLRGYTRVELSRLEARAQAILIEGASLASEAEHSGSFFVFSADRELVYSNRGRGRSISEEELLPVTYDGQTIGYFYAEGVRFLESSANRFVLASLAMLAGVSILVSAVVAVLVARRSAKTISRAITTLRSDLRTVRSLQPVASRTFEIAELTEISQTMHSVSSVLSDEEAYKRRWMQDIAHDLRSPISGIKGQLEGMRDGVLEPTEDRFTRTLADVKRLEEMVASITELHAIESMASLATEAIEIDALFAEIEAAHENALREAGASIESSASVATLPANRSLLLRAISNIVENAIRYGGSGVSVQLDAVETDGAVEIRIANNGRSIPPDQLERVFQRFFRGEFARKTQGSGLGLSIANQIATRHGGALSVRNLEPTGVEFRLALPLRS